MQGQRRSVDPFPGMKQGFKSSNSGSVRQISGDNIIHPVENHLPNYFLSPGDGNLTRGNSVDCVVQGSNYWNMGESSSNLNYQQQLIDDGAKLEYGCSSLSSFRSQSGLRFDKRQPETSDIISNGNVDVGLGSGCITNGPLFYPGSGFSSCHIPHNVNLNAGFSGNNGPYMQAGPSATDYAGSSAQHFCQEDDDGGSGLSANWGVSLSCKRKVFDTSSHQFYSSECSSCFPQSDNSIWNPTPSRYNTSGNLDIATPPTSTPNASHPDYMHQAIGLCARPFASDAIPYSQASSSAEMAIRNLNRRSIVGHQREIAPFNLSATRNLRNSYSFFPHSSSRLPSISNPFDLRHPGFSRSMMPSQLWNESSGSIAGSSSHSASPFGERGNSLGEEANVRNIPQINGAQPVFFHPSEPINMGQDAARWCLANGDVGNYGEAPFTSQIVTGSGAHTLSSRVWTPNQNSSAQIQQRLRELPPSSAFPQSFHHDSSGRNARFPAFSAGTSASSRDMMLSFGSNYQRHHCPFPGSMLEVERQGADIRGSSNSSHALAVDIEGRQRLISEIRRALSAMRRGEHLWTEDYLLFDYQLLYHGMVDLHDRHRDMRLDVDNMSYEELLALEERIGDVKTGLSEECIMKLMERTKFAAVLGSDSCCICQEEYRDGDEVGKIPCRHDFHTECIKLWLMKKNVCPICKITALVAPGNSAT